MADGIAAWFNETGSTGAPAYSAVEHRRLDAVLMTQAVGDRTGGRPGIHPSTGPGITIAASTLSISKLLAVVYPAQSATDGPYRAIVMDQDLTVTAADATNDRVDKLTLRVEDDDTDSSGQKRAIGVLYAGTPASVPAAPADVAGELTLGTVAVAAGGSPAPVWTLSADNTVALGGIIPVADAAGLPSAGLYDGAAAYVADTEAVVVAKGGTWSAIGSRKGYQYWQTVAFTASGSFAKASYPGLRAVRARVQGGGGGGGGSEATTGTEASSSGGGGGGAYAETFVAAASLSSTETVTVGAGGASSAGVDGATGGTSSFGSHAVAPGGNGGFSRGESSGFRASSGANPTSGGTGDLIVQGGAGAGGISFGSSVVSSATDDKGIYGRGGGSHLGGDGRSARGPDTAAEAGVPYGGGGSGNICGFDGVSGEAAKAGGAGAIGVVLVDVYV